MQELISRLRVEIIQASTRREFVHRSWYIKYHVDIVEEIAGELCDLRPGANRGLVEALVWIHDYGKMLAPINQDELTLSEGRKLLDRLGFPQDFSNRVLEYVSLLDRSWEVDLSQAPLEVQIVSSADGCSHLVGPFFHFWWKEHPDTPVEVLMEDNRKKLYKDWHRKIVLPEARNAFRERHRFACEQSGEIPQAFFSATK